MADGANEQYVPSDLYVVVHLKCRAACVSEWRVIWYVSKYYVIFIYSQVAVSALLVVSVLYVEKKLK